MNIMRNEERMKQAGKLYWDWVAAKRPERSRPVFHGGRWRCLAEMLRAVNYGRSHGLRRHAAGWMVYVQMAGKPTYMGSRRTAVEAMEIKLRLRPAGLGDFEWEDLQARLRSMALVLDQPEHNTETRKKDDVA